MNENPLQGSFIIDELTDLVEAAVLAEFDRINERGGVLGAMETGYQRGRIQDESMLYEQRKHDGSLPIIGVNTFRKPDTDRQPAKVELARATETEKESQLRRVREFQDGAPRRVRRRARPAQDSGDQRGERVRRADGRRPGVLAAAGHRGVLRGGWAVPAQRVCS
jgi:methylmalonyl-CoA mutase